MCQLESSGSSSGAGYSSGRMVNMYAPSTAQYEKNRSFVPFILMSYLGSGSKISYSRGDYKQ